MRAAWYDRLGLADEVIEIGEVETPSASRGELRVRLAASAVNPSDVKRRLGGHYSMEYARVIPNSDGAGIVNQVGKDVSQDWLGKRVWLYNGQRGGRAFGTASESITLAENLVTALPDTVTFAEGACLGIPAMTAHHAVFCLGPVEGRTVLVTGGAGAVGHYAVQLAKWGGATVIATVSGPEKAEDAAAAGADLVINYRSDDVAERILSETDGVDHIVEVAFGANLDTTTKVLKNNSSMGIYASDAVENPTLPYRFFLGHNVRLRFFVLNGIPLSERDRARRDITRWLGEAKPIHRVAGVFPLDEIAAAHELVESGTKRGTVIVQPGDLGCNG